MGGFSTTVLQASSLICLSSYSVLLRIRPFPCLLLCPFFLSTYHPQTVHSSNLFNLLLFLLCLCQRFQNCEFSAWETQSCISRTWSHAWYLVALVEGKTRRRKLMGRVNSRYVWGRGKHEDMKGQDTADEKPSTEPFWLLPQVRTLSMTLGSPCTNPLISHLYHKNARQFTGHC